MTATFTPEMIAALSEPLDRDAVKTRQQSGRSLSYIEGWHAIAEANRIFGFDGWTRETLETRLVAEREREIGHAKTPGWNVSYICRVRIVAHGIARDGTGSGHGIDKDLGLAHESAIKEAETDAMKRALMTFGNPFGLALYDKEQTNVVEKPSDKLLAALENIKSHASKATLRTWLSSMRGPNSPLTPAEVAAVTAEAKKWAETLPDSEETAPERKAA